MIDTLTAQGSRGGGRRGRGLALVAAVTLVAAGVLSGCSASPTVVFTTVQADPSAPPVLILRMTVISTANPGLTSDAQLRSQSDSSDAADRPGPFVFPIYLPISVDPSFGGEVMVTVEGLDWDQPNEVTAAGSTTAQIVPKQQTDATLTLVAGPLTCGNDVVDPGETCDDGNHLAGDGCSPGCQLEVAPDAGAD
jgi:cysteine-rich repeat protein